MVEAGLSDAGLVGPRSGIGELAGLGRRVEEREVMATIPEGTRVSLDPQASEAFTYPPHSPALIIAVHPGALQAKQNRLTQVVEVDGADIIWTGSIDEGLLSILPSSPQKLRKLLGQNLLRGVNLWSIIRPGPLRKPGSALNDTVYQGDRPWIVVGELASGALLAMPLNEYDGRRAIYNHPIDAGALNIPGAKPSKLELNHLWSFPPCSAVANLSQIAHVEAAAAIRKYYP
jgi:hypothetical protein